MTVKELKKEMEDMPDDALILVINKSGAALLTGDDAAVESARLSWGEIAPMFFIEI